jgi:lysozyme
MMQVSDKGLVALAIHEGIVLGPYRDSVGVMTIGVGHTAKAGPPDPANMGPITLQEAVKIYMQDRDNFSADVRAALKVPVSQHEFDALVSFHFNTGGIRKAKLTEHLNRGDRKAAAAAFMGWLKPPEIKRRRVAEQTLFRYGVYPTGNIPLYRSAGGRAVRDGSITAEHLLAMMKADTVPAKFNIWAAILRFFGKEK